MESTLKKVVIESGLKKTLIFTGAGMSVPLGLPSTMDFMDAVKQDPQAVTQHVIEYLGASGQDIEWILSSLESLSNETPFIEFLLPHLAKNGRSQEALPYMTGALSSLKKQAVSETTRIKKIIFDKLRQYEAEQALSLYLNLFKEIKKTFNEPSISLITTNYDLTFETALEASPKKWENIGIEDVDFGFSIKLGRPIYDASQDFGWTSSVVEYLKIHGSVDWHRDSKGQCSRSMSSTTPDDPDQMAILYPGFKGVPEIEPFISMHRRLNQRLTEADRIIVIGFAFRDAYINNIFENIMRVRPDIYILYFNPLSIDAFPEDSLVPHFINNYPAFKHIKRGVTAETCPLKLHLNSILI